MKSYKEVMTMNAENQTFNTRWPDLGDSGYVQVPNLLIEYQHELGITHSEFVVLLGIMRHGQSKKTSYPGPKRLGSYNGLKKLQIQLNIRSLKKKGIIKIYPRPGTTSIYDISPLKEKLKGYAHRIKKVISPYQKPNTRPYQRFNTKEDESNKIKRRRPADSGKLESMASIIARTHSP